MNDCYAVFFDAGYFRSRFKLIKGRHRTAEDVRKYCDRYKGISYFKNSELYRIFYHDSLPPAPGTDYSKTEHFNPLKNQMERAYKDEFLDGSHRLWAELATIPFMALRKGTLATGNWEINRNKRDEVIKKLISKVPLEGDDLVKYPKQKQVDMKIGMDIAHICIKRLVNKIILIAGDADMAPAAKLARVEGVQVFLDAMGFKDLRSELLDHVDVVLENKEFEMKE